MHAVTSDYKWTEQNRLPLHSPRLVMASYSLQTTGSQEMFFLHYHKLHVRAIPTYTVY